MPRIESLIRCEINPAQPVPELCSVISAVAAYHQGQEQAILLGLQDAIGKRLAQITRKDADLNGEQIRKSNGD